MLYKTHSHNPLETSWRRCTAHNELCMHTVSVLSNSDPITPTLIHLKTTPTPNQSNHLMIKFKLLLRSYFSPYTIFSQVLTLLQVQPLRRKQSFLCKTRCLHNHCRSKCTKNIRSGVRQKQFGDVFSKLLQLPTNRTIGRSIRFFENWKLLEFLFQASNYYLISGMKCSQNF